LGSNRIEEIPDAREGGFRARFLVQDRHPAGHGTADLTAEASGRHDVADTAVGARQVLDRQQLRDQRLAAAGWYREDHAPQFRVQR
jgi:hypothetical protein